jgi:hypothetical protein
VHEADQPDLVSDFPDADRLPGEHRNEDDFEVSDAGSAALGHLNGSVVKRIIRVK